MTRSTSVISGYEAFQEMRGELLDMVDGLAGVVGGLDQATLAASVGDLRDRIARDDFSVIVMGEFNAGKSTTVNALLGQKVLPAKGKPTTAVLTVVTWGEGPAVTLHPLDPGQPELSIEPARLVDHITIDAEGASHRWGRAEVRWPLALCRNNVRIIDSPGLNEDEERSRITLEHTAGADAVVFVVSALRALSQSEREVIDRNLHMFDQANLYLLVNRINQVDEDDVEEVRADLLSRAREYWGLGEDRVLFVDSKSALTARVTGDPRRVESSGLPAFERSLERFLTEQRGRVKVVGAAVDIRELAATARDTIDDLSTLMDRDLELLDEEYQRQQLPLDRLWRERGAIDRILRNHLDATHLQVEESAKRMLAATADSCVEWAAAEQHRNRVGLKFWKARADAKALAEEVVTTLSDSIMRHVEEWRDGELTELLEARATDLEEQLGRRLVVFAENLEEIRTSLLNVGDVDGREHLPSRASQITGAGIGLLLNPGALLVGSQLGVKEMVKTLIPQLAVAFGLSLLGFGPAVLLAAVVSTGFLNTLFKMDKLNERIVRAAAEAVAEQLRDSTPELAAKLADNVHTALDAHRQRIDRELADSITQVRDKVQYALQQRDGAKEVADKRRQRLAGYRRSLDAIQRRAAKAVEERALAR
ncbi:MULTISPECIES: dynamin family protein [unclassified Nocardiopsis]|uniref:dynamin family protein n=1 Tax=Nocardiopsis TaxID=2013 RepID=UPI00387B51D6